MFSGIVTCLGEIIRMTPEGAGGPGYYPPDFFRFRVLGPSGARVVNTTKSWAGPVPETRTLGFKTIWKGKVQLFLPIRP